MSDWTDKSMGTRLPLGVSSGVSWFCWSVRPPAVARSLACRELYVNQHLADCCISVQQSKVALEGRCSIQLSYGRVSCMFLEPRDLVHALGRPSCVATATSTVRASLSHHFNQHPIETRLDNDRFVVDARSSGEPVAAMMLGASRPAHRPQFDVGSFVANSMTDDFERGSAFLERKACLLAARELHREVEPVWSTSRRRCGQEPRTQPIPPSDQL